MQVLFFLSLTRHFPPLPSVCSTQRLSSPIFCAEVGVSFFGSALEIVIVCSEASFRNRIVKNEKRTKDYLR